MCSSDLGDYARSLRLLAEVKRQAPDQVTKSGLMVGLGEDDQEIAAVLGDLRAVGVDIVTVGQYLRPTRKHLPVDRYVPPEGFRHYERSARALGFSAVYSGVFVRSSFNAEEVALQHGFEALSSSTHVGGGERRCTSSSEPS